MAASVPAVAETAAAGADPVASDPGAPRAELVFEALVDIAPTEALGPGPLGQRRIVPITGGTFSGPRIRGVVRPGGADRQLVRPDGVRQLHALYEIETDDRAVITVSNRVLIDDTGTGPRYAMSHIELTAPEGRYDWLNRRVFVGTLGHGDGSRRQVRVRVFSLETPKVGSNP